MNRNALVNSFPIVGIGASAGGLEAATLLLKNLPIDLGMGFVLVQHLDPRHESILADLLSRTSLLPVKEAKDNTIVLPNQVYVIPHNKDITILHGVLKLTTRHKDEKLHMPIDQFFRSLAESHQEMAIGVILSGTATDGTLGLKAIKDAGGITFAQDKTAKYQGMPKAAINSGYVDFVIEPSGIAKELTSISNHPYILQHIEERQELPEEEEGLKKIFFMLHKSFGIDFHHYKEATVKRRIKRRMLLHKLKTLRAYTEYLKKNSDEIAYLYDDLLINVTSFFREPLTLKFLQNTISPRLLHGRVHKDPIRVWVPGCATGEEVYSIAITLSEFLEDKSLNIPVMIIGTDISKAAVEKARAGEYSHNDVDDISPKRLARFFEKKDGVYKISKPIRELCIFAQHNVFDDPPFARLDLISCRNLLIYFNADIQSRILRSFHFALKSDGFLMLGKSETVGASPALFTQIDKKYKMYTRKDTARNIDVTTSMSSLEKRNTSNVHAIFEGEVDSSTIQKKVDTILLSSYTPASVVINNELEIIEFRGSTGKYLEPSTGKASFNLIKMAKEGLGFELRSAIAKVKKSGNSFKKLNIPIKHNGNIQLVSFEVIPLKFSQREALYLILFEDLETVALKAKTLPSGQGVRLRKREAKDQLIVELEHELAQTREDMRVITEEQEATNEELQAANEEAISSNEELQSINEELETSQEELESTNEELITVNEELQNRNEQLIEARDYAEGIISTVQIPLIVLDRDLRVKTANRSFLQTFQVTEKETIGNFIYDLGNGQWTIPALRKLLKEILPKNNTFDNYEIEHTFPSIGHKVMLLNARRFYEVGENILLAINDVTHHRDVEKQKDIFIGIASHELKTPITTMKAYTQILEKRLLGRGDNRDIYLIQNVNKQTDKLISLVNDLLNITKIQAGKLVLEKHKFDVNAMVTKAVVDFQYTTETHQIIKEGAIKREVFGDQNRIEQVLSNLITNAIKYSPQADKVIVRVGTDKNNAIISVQDFGFGISKKDKAKVFERFYRTNDKEEKNIAGFGLGLYISAEIVRGHKGKIWVESTKGKGSTFYFSLPFKKEG